MCVGAVVPWVRPCVGAVATQALTNPDFGPLGLAMLRAGLTAKQTLDGLLATDEGRDQRQLAIVDDEGQAAAWTGGSCIAYAGHRTGEGYSVQANMMHAPSVIEAMARAFESTRGDLAGRMMAALTAAQGEGGDIRGMQSAALRVVQSGARGEGAISIIPRYDLRVDENAQPVEELARLVRLRSAQLKSNDGFSLAKSGKLEEAKQIWVEARKTAPELEELGFWQAVALADDEGDFEGAVDILGPILKEDRLRGQWVDLIDRIQACGIIENAGIAPKLIAALEDYWGE
jgi:uncharacterized Ntn-hydrolase superfamily protein